MLLSSSNTNTQEPMFIFAALYKNTTISNRVVALFSLSHSFPFACSLYVCVFFSLSLFLSFYHFSLSPYISCAHCLSTVAMPSCINFSFHFDSADRIPVAKRKRVEVGTCEHQLQVQCCSCNVFFLSVQAIPMYIGKKDWSVDNFRTKSESESKPWAMNIR